ncbi:hypothetical protein BsWGS_20618 [Bradybaena similaris]
MTGSDGMQKMLPEAHSKRKHPLHPLCARTAFSCNKLVLFIYALLFLFVGILLTAVGVLVELHRDRIEPVNNHLALPTALLIAVGLIIAINALCGMVGTILENPLLLKVFFATTVLCFLLQVAIGIIAFIYREQLPHAVSSQFMFAVRGYGKDGDIQTALDWLQTEYQCCGFNNYQDYSKENEQQFKGNAEKPIVPESCCKQKGVVMTRVCGYEVNGNITLSDDVNVEGCTYALINWLMEHLDLVGAIALGFAIPQIFGILLSYYFLRKVKEYRVWYRVDFRS